jgi:hypothetical protein
MGLEATKITRQHADLTDALARGRLTLAEVAAIPPSELDALYELGAQCLDTERDAEAVDLLGGLVALFPFAAAYWRAYAIALHRCLELERARAAYEAALLLQPDHARTRCYRSEVLLYLGHKDEARAELGTLVASPDKGVAERAGDLLRRFDVLDDWRPEPVARTADEGEPEPFELDDARALPLVDSRFQTPAADYAPTPREVTNTARVFAPVASPDAAPQPLWAQDETDTALLPGRPDPADSAQHLGRRDDTTETGILRARAEITDTGILPGRGPGEGDDTADPRRGDPVPARREKTGTDLIPGRVRARALEAAGQSAAPIVTPPATPESTATDLIPERARARAIETAGDTSPAPPSAVLPDDVDDESEVTHTAVHLRRTGVPLVDELGERSSAREAESDGHPVAQTTPEEANG